MVRFLTIRGPPFRLERRGGVEGDSGRVTPGVSPSYSLVTSALGTEIMHSRMCLKKLSLTSWS